MSTVRQIPLYASADTPEPKELSPSSVAPTGPVMMGHDVGAADPQSAYLLGIVHGICIAIVLAGLVIMVRRAFRPRRQRIQMDWPSERM